jgi:glucokinase
MEQLIVAIDLGGTKVAGGLVDAKGGLQYSLTVLTRAAEGFEVSYGQVERLVERLVKKAGGRHKVCGIGICAPGPLNPKKGLVINPPNLPGWVNIRLAEMISTHFGLPAKVENDANAAGLAEALFGAAVRYRDVLYATVSTGIGTGLIIDKQIYHGKNGVAAEGGHVTIDFNSAYRCACGTLGCIEALASGPAMARRARVMLEQDHAAPSRLRDGDHRAPQALTPEFIAQCAKKGDQLARAVLDETGFYLGVWLAALMTMLDPDAVVIGGGVAQIGKPLFDMIYQTIPHYSINRKFLARTPILPAKLKRNVGIFGAASLFLREK